MTCQTPTSFWPSLWRSLALIGGATTTACLWPKGSKPSANSPLRTPILRLAVATLKLNPQRPYVAQKPQRKHGRKPQMHVIN